MLDMESPADRAGLFFDAPDLALFAEIDDALDDNGAAVVIVERNVICRFDRAYRQVGDGESFHPIALCLDEDVVYLKQGGRVMLKGHVWEVDNRMPDGTGFTQLLLKKIGGFRYDSTDLNVQAGFPYYFPLELGHVESLSVDGPNTDPDNPRLAYPYTVKTYLDWSPGTARL